MSSRKYTREELNYEGELYEGEREELLSGIDEKERSISRWRGYTVLAAVGFAAFCAYWLGPENFRLGLGPDIIQQHAGSLVCGAIGVIGWRVMRKPGMAALEGIAMALFIWECFGGPASMR